MDETRSSPGRFSGSMDDLMEILRFFCLAQMSHSIKVESNEGAGYIHIAGGKISHAEIDNLRGEAAFYVMARWKEGGFETWPLKMENVQSIEKPWETLISAAMSMREAKVRRADADKVEDRDEQLYQKISKMKVVERVKLALSGDKEARTILLRDSNRVVQVAVMTNPRITESEIAGIANSRNVDEEVLRKIANSREWVKAYPVRLALVRNPKSPLGAAVRLVPTLLVQDLKQIAKSKSVPTAVANAARRLLVQKG